MESANHPLALKVMRISRPALANSWQPFFTTSAAFSAHATESLVSLQGEEPFAGHPKTLRDLSYGLELLSLPAAFGAIQLGETFSSCLCLNNEAKSDVQFISMRIEIQTATNKLLLKDISDSRVLHPGELLETVVSYEMKEIGQHVLCCSVSYRLSHVQEVQTIHKYYKFMATNPLHVRTKVHVPRSASAFSSVSEREKLFLEVHIQNLTQQPIWFEQLHFLPIDGWKLLGDSLSLKSPEILQPQDICQFVFTLFPVLSPLVPFVYPPGTIIPLGRLDIEWRSSMGEPGRLLTSVLTRRIPPLLNQTPTPIPPHLQHRPHSPLSRSSTPPLPSSSPLPLKTRIPSQQSGVRPQSPIPAVVVAPGVDLEVDLSIHFSTTRVKVGQPFEIEFQLTLAGLMPEYGYQRMIQLAVQHVTSSSTYKDIGPSRNTPLSSPRISIDSSAKSLIARPSHGTDSQASPISKPLDLIFSGNSLIFKRDSSHYSFPSPLSSLSMPSSVVPLGSSVTWLPQLKLHYNQNNTGKTQTSAPKSTVTGLFRSQFLPIRPGFGTLGGLRVLIVEDRIIKDDETDENLPLSSVSSQNSCFLKHLKEWDIVSDIWITS